MNPTHIALAKVADECMAFLHQLTPIQCVDDPALTMVWQDSNHLVSSIADYLGWPKP